MLLSRKIISCINNFCGHRKYKEIGKEYPMNGNTIKYFAQSYLQLSSSDTTNTCGIYTQAFKRKPLLI